MINSWDYLIVTASNESQAQNYQQQIQLRRQLGMLTDINEVLVVPDPGGRRIGSGGSTLGCLIEVIKREQKKEKQSADHDRWKSILADLRVMIIHAGGDSRRLPAYGPCGKIFVPVPGESDSVLPVTLFDRQLPTYLALPAPPAGRGQVVITSGDVMLRFDPAGVDFSSAGLTGLGCFAPPEQAQNHGVYCCRKNSEVVLYLQKPTPETQKKMEAVDHYHQAILDIGVMSFDAQTANHLLEMFDIQITDNNEPVMNGEMADAVQKHGLDFYREICCGMGTEATSAHHIESARKSGSQWNDVLLGRMFQGLSDIPFHVNLLPHCEFIDFGTTQHIIPSGTRLLQQDRGASNLSSCLNINNDISEQGQLVGHHSWVEGCEIHSPIHLAGDNVVTGIDIDSEKPLTLPRQACLDVIPGFDRQTRDVWFVRCYQVTDTIKDGLQEGATLCGVTVSDWLAAVAAGPDDVWDNQLPSENRSVWNGRFFPAVRRNDDYRKWLWMFDPSAAAQDDIDRWHQADRYSLSEIARQTNHHAFCQRRIGIRAKNIQQSLRWMFRRASGFSADELACLIKLSPDKSGWIKDVLKEAHWQFTLADGLDSLTFSRTMHSLATAVVEAGADPEMPMQVLTGNDFLEQMSPAEQDWLDAAGLDVDSEISVSQWCLKACRLAFQTFERSIISSGVAPKSIPRNALRSDEIVWGRAPARFDTGGGWTDTPPYSLENGGSVVGIAVDLNGQPPIQAYAKLIDQPVIRIASIDLGTRIEISSLPELLDYRQATSEYGLAKAALALSGFSPQTAEWPRDITLPKMLEMFGGGLELTTLAAIPKGSGLGTSSIMGAVILAVIQRVMGHVPTQKELFHGVLRLEQALTTGGGGRIKSAVPWVVSKSLRLNRV